MGHQCFLKEKFLCLPWFIYNRVDLYITYECMVTITLELPKNMQRKFKTGTRVSFDDFTATIFWDAYVSPDVTFTSIENLSEQEKKELIEAKKYNATQLINI
jgi:hypothetical protein